MESKREEIIDLKNPSGEEHTISIEKANLVALAFILPITLFYALPYYFIWKENVFGSLKLITLWIFLASIPLGIILHEFLHGLTWAIFVPNCFKSISFGIKWEYLMPYCHSSSPLKVWQYVLGGLAPLLFMGVLPAVYSLIYGGKLVMFFAMFFTWAAGGDIQILWMLRKFRKDQLVLDHPDDPGFIVLKG
jgi:hypothetical protein